MLAVAAGRPDHDVSISTSSACWSRTTNFAADPAPSSVPGGCQAGARRRKLGADASRRLPVTGRERHGEVAFSRAGRRSTHLVGDPNAEILRPQRQLALDPCLARRPRSAAPRQRAATGPRLICPPRPEVHIRLSVRSLDAQRELRELRCKSLGFGVGNRLAPFDRSVAVRVYLAPVDGESRALSARQPGQPPVAEDADELLAERPPRRLR